MDAVFNPWEVKGDIDYQKLVTEFGVKPLKTLSPAFKSNILFRRGVIFAHRDIQKILDAKKEGKPFVMMTGLMPSGKFHLGHMLVAQQILFYQALGAKVYIAVADIECYNARGQDLAKSREIAIDQYILNYIALGLRPENCEIYFQSDRSRDARKANAYYRLQNLLARHATFNEFRAVYGEITPGKMVSALLQASDMLHPQLPEFGCGQVPTVVPVGIDQDPHLRIARDIAKRIPGTSFEPLSSTYHRFMPGLSGGKMSSSDPNSYIALTDDEKQVKNKINKYAFSGGRATVEEHREKGGNPEIDVSFQYLWSFFEDDDARIAKIREDYQAGRLLTGELKAILIAKMSAFLSGIHKRREEAKLDRFISL